MKKYKFKSKCFKLLLFAVLFLFLLVVFLFFLNHKNISCTKIDSLPTSIIVEKGAKNVVGLNADTDSLNFGKVSPGSIVKRSVKVSYNKDAVVFVSINSTFDNFNDWIKIDSTKFYLVANEDQEVFFSITVPLYAEDKDYFGEVLFCFKE